MYEEQFATRIALISRTLTTESTRFHLLLDQVHHLLFCLSTVNESGCEVSNGCIMYFAESMSNVEQLFQRVECKLHWSCKYVYKVFSNGVHTNQTKQWKLEVGIRLK